VASIKADTHDYAWGTYIVVRLLISLGRMRKRRHPPSTATPRRTRSGRGCYQLGPMQKGEVRLCFHAASMQMHSRPKFGPPLHLDDPPGPYALGYWVGGTPKF
jgi:hypothetical protein